MKLQPSLKTLRVLATAIGLVLTLGVISSFVVEDDSSADVASRASATTTTSSADDDDDDDLETGPTGSSSTVATDPGDGTTATTGDGDEPITTVPGDTTPGGGSSPQTTVAGSTAPQPTTPGTYEYDTDGTLKLGNTSRDLPPVTTLVVAEPDADGRQVHVRDLRDDAGDGSVTRTTFRTTPEGVFLERLEIESSFSGFGQTSVLVATSPFLVIPAGATTGTTTTGTLSGDGTTAEVTFRLTELGPVESTSEIEAVLSGNIEGTQSSTQRARTSDRLIVFEHVVSDVMASGVRVQSDYEATLRA